MEDRLAELEQADKREKLDEEGELGPELMGEVSVQIPAWVHVRFRLLAISSGLCRCDDVREDCGWPERSTTLPAGGSAAHAMFFRS